ncbi:12377_t:CDS:2 [Acaulospora morrowiae]|uniref:12377_t:CDS:1 n=1 Tax=Acaulospora morrowiae TaxID=94023 RepID=A0A9N8YXP1_9GLOM|nr:12377_t:CDS:2 [Acaulospora morrowiae]
MSTPGQASEALNFLIGFSVSFAASVMNAAGLNLLKLDHVKNSSMPPNIQRNECGRPLWHFGLYLYIASQLIGSTIALNFLKAQWVAPLGSISLIFNFIFARMFVGTRITRRDIIGTFVVIISVIWIVIFGGIDTDGDDDLTLGKLKSLMIRPLFIVYFSFLNILTFGLFGTAIYCYWILKDEHRKMRDNFFKGIDTLRLRKVVGMTMASVGGLTASQTLLLAKSGVKLFYISITSSNQFTDSLSKFILVGLAVTAVLQVYCLNTALKLHDSVLVVPMFYGFYTAMGLVNSVIYLGEIGTYPGYALILVGLGIVVLVYGVCMLSETKEIPNTGTVEFEFEDEDEVKNENAHGTGKWDDFSIGGSSSAAGSDVELYKQNSNSTRGRFGDGRIFSFSNKSGLGFKPGFFRMSRLGSKNRTEFREVGTKLSQISLENSSSPHVIIDQDDEFSDDEFITQQIATPPEAAVTDDLLSFSGNSLSQSSAAKNIDESLSLLISKNQFLSKTYEDEVESVLYAQSFDDLLKTKDLSKENDKPDGDRS